MEFEGFGRARSNRMHSHIPLGDSLAGGWVYRCDVCVWTGISKVDICECPKCGEDTHRAPQSVTDSEMALHA